VPETAPAAVLITASLAADTELCDAVAFSGVASDPAFFRRAGLPHTFGDPAQARSWYRRAFDLDDDKAKRRRNAVDTK